MPKPAAESIDVSDYAPRAAIYFSRQRARSKHALFQRFELAKILGGEFYLDHNAPPRLTNSDEKVLMLGALGLTNKEIGGKIFLTENTIKSQQKHMMRKLQAHTRYHAVAQAFETGALRVSQGISLTLSTLFTNVTELASQGQDWDTMTTALDEDPNKLKSAFGRERKALGLHDLASAVLIAHLAVSSEAIIQAQNELPPEVHY